MSVRSHQEGLCEGEMEIRSNEMILLVPPGLPVWEATPTCYHVCFSDDSVKQALFLQLRQIREVKKLDYLGEIAGTQDPEWDFWNQTSSRTQPVNSVHPLSLLLGSPSWLQAGWHALHSRKLWHSNCPLPWIYSQTVHTEDCAVLGGCCIPSAWLGDTRRRDSSSKRIPKEEDVSFIFWNKNFLKSE